MNDTGFEQDLRTVLRALAPAEVPESLREAVAAVPRTHPLPASARAVPGRPPVAAFAALAAVVVVLVAGLAVLLGGQLGGNVAAPTPSTSTSTAPAALEWVTVALRVQPIEGRAPAQQDVQNVGGVISLRLQWLYGESHLVINAGDPTITTMAIPSSQASWVGDALAMTGDVAIVPLGQTPAAAGDPIDTASHPPLFGNEGIAGASSGVDQTGHPALELTLTPDAAKTFGAWTSAHIGDYLAVVMDGVVATAPVIRSPIPDGRVEINLAPDGNGSTNLDALGAVIASGPLPHAVVVVGSAPASPTGANPGASLNPATPVPSPSAVAVVPPIAIASELPTSSGAPASVDGPWTGLTVGTLTGPAVDTPLVTAWAHGYLGRGSGTAAAWSSSDGRAWTPWPDGFLGLGSGGARLVGFAPCRDGALAIIGTGGGLDAARTADGRTWLTSPVVTGTDPVVSFASSVAGGPGGAVVAPVRGTTLQVTTDCSTWTPVRMDTPADSVITGVAAVGSGFVAVGIASPTSNPRAAAWWSPDGLAWNMAPVENSAGLGFAMAPAVGASGLVAFMAVVGDTTGNMTLYSSADGKSWFPGSWEGTTFTKQNPDGTWSAAVNLVSDGRHVLAYGPPHGDAAKPVEYWVTTDGSGWQKLPLAGAGAATVTSPDTAGQHPPALLRDGILFTSPDGSALFGQATGQ